MVHQPWHGGPEECEQQQIGERAGSGGQPVIRPGDAHQVQQCPNNQDQAATDKPDRLDGKGLVHHKGHGAVCAAEQQDYPRKNTVDHFHGFGLAPKIAVPTRTQVDPSSIATSKSCDMPMESTSISMRGNLRAAIWSRRSRNNRKYMRAPSGSSVNGGTVIRPRT